jgi:hypothetical protein
MSGTHGCGQWDVLFRLSEEIVRFSHLMKFAG